MLALAHKASSLLVKSCDSKHTCLGMKQTQILMLFLFRGARTYILQMEKNVLSPKLKPLTT